MSPEELEQHEWNRLKEQREIEKGRREEKQFIYDYSYFTRWTKILIPMFLAIIAAAQIYLAWQDHSEKSQRDEIAQTLAFAQLKLMWAHEVAAQHDMLAHANPLEVCHAVKILEFAAPPMVKGGPEAFFNGNAGLLKVDAKLCNIPDELKKAVSQYKEGLWGPFRFGADSPYIRKDPITKQLFTHKCDVDTVARAGLVSKTCELPKNIEGKIYRAEYVCTDYKCGWSYGREKGNYDQVVDVKERQIIWSRIWDGDAHREGYILYYEKKQSGEPPSTS